jgi:hypothetical protein
MIPDKEIINRNSKESPRPVFGRADLRMATENNMRIIYYSAANEPSGERLQRVVEMNFPRNDIEACRTIEALSQSLQQPAPDLLIVVLLAASREELSDIMMLRELLLDRRIILVLPDDKPETASRGHMLRPRFITYRNGDYSDVSVVLGRMIKSYESSCQVTL